MLCYEPIFYFLSMNLSMLIEGDPVSLNVNGFGGWPKLWNHPQIELNFNVVLHFYNSILTHQIQEQPIRIISFNLERMSSKK